MERSVVAGESLVLHYLSYPATEDHFLYSFS